MYKKNDFSDFFHYIIHTTYTSTVTTMKAYQKGKKHLMLECEQRADFFSLSEKGTTILFDKGKNYFFVTATFRCFRLSHSPILLMTKRMKSDRAYKIV